MITLPATTMHIGTHLNRQHAIEVAKNKKILLNIFVLHKYLARQGLPLRGQDNDSDSNFIQLLKHCGEDDHEIHQRQRKNPTSTHHMKSRIL